MKTWNRIKVQLSRTEPYGKRSLKRRFPLGIEASKNPSHQTNGFVVKAFFKKLIFFINNIGYYYKCGKVVSVFAFYLPTLKLVIRHNMSSQLKLADDKTYI